MLDLGPSATAGSTRAARRAGAGTPATAGSASNTVSGRNATQPKSDSESSTFSWPFLQIKATVILHGSVIRRVEVE
jgi:hypothetical protein